MKKYHDDNDPLCLNPACQAKGPYPDVLPSVQQVMSTQGAAGLSKWFIEQVEATHDTAGRSRLNHAAYVCLSQVPSSNLGFHAAFIRMCNKLVDQKDENVLRSALIVGAGMLRKFLTRSVDSLMDELDGIAESNEKSEYDADGLILQFQQRQQELQDMRVLGAVQIPLVDGKPDPEAVAEAVKGMMGGQPVDKKNLN